MVIDMYKRIFLITFDSLGIGNAKDAKKYNDFGSNTLNNVLKYKPFRLPCLEKLGLLNLASDLCFHTKDYDGIICKLNPISVGKDSFSGHYELMGLKIENPCTNFALNGIPQELILELESKWKRKIIGNKISNARKIVNELGDIHLTSGDVIVYVDEDSTLEIAASEEIIPVEDLYKLCEIAFNVLSKKEWKIDKIIARPFIGKNITNFTFTNNKREFCSSPSMPSYLDNLKEAGYDVITIGDIDKIFNNNGITYHEDIKSNIDGLDRIINIAKNVDFTGLCFLNLSEFDREYAHKRNPAGYLNCLEDVDVKLRSFIKNIKDDDLLIISSGYSNDPTYKGINHTREQIPFLAYSKSLTNKGHMISARDGFGCVGATIIDNFNIKQKSTQLGTSLLNLIK